MSDQKGNSGKTDEAGGPCDAIGYGADDERHYAVAGSVMIAPFNP
jgi:hypothetical protein